MLFDPVVERLGEVAPDVRVVVPLRAGYETGDPPDQFTDMVHDVVARARAAGRVLLVGVSGGATLALAALLTGDRSVVGAITHEPLIGPVARDLHARVSERAATLAAAPGAQPVVDFVSGLMGQPTWSSLPAAAKEFAVQHCDVVRHEVQAFVGFAPDISSFRTIGAPLTVTTGQDSGPARHAAAAAIAGSGSPLIRIEVLPNCGHLANWQQPAELVRIVRRHLAALEEHT
jgi:pimeloyl-ACP methyl ester carboxylesterase